MKKIQAIGKVSFGILLVVYTERINKNGHEFIRIIAVKKASLKNTSVILTLNTKNI